jgi:thiamine-phosphate pyrophosphorylase
VTLTPPIFCLVTDCHRLGAILETPPYARPTLEALLTQVTAAAEAGVNLVHLREPDMPAGSLVGLVRAVRDRVGALGTRVVVNDRLDVALAGGADGVHLKSTSIAVTDVRALVISPWLIGRSLHTAGDVERVGSLGADYLVFGTVFPTRSKPPGWQTAGLTALAAIVKAAAPVPVLGIGGIGPGQAAGVARAGAAGVAAIDAFLPTDRTRIEDTVHGAVQRMRTAFDSTWPLS